MKPALKQAVDREWARKTTAAPEDGSDRRQTPAATAGAPPSAAAPTGTSGTDSQTQRRRLSDFLLAEGLITPDQFAAVMAEQKRTNEKLPALVVRMGLMNEEQMVDAQARHRSEERRVGKEGRSRGA